MVEPADEPDVEHYVAQRLAGSLMAPAGVMLALVRAVPKAELLSLLLQGHAMNREPDSLAAEFVRAWLTYFEPGEEFMSGELINRVRPRDRLDGVVDRICADSSSGVGKARALGRFLRKNAGFSFAGHHIEECRESRGATVWTIEEDGKD